MNKWNKLLAAFDRVYGFGDQKKSAFRKVSQSYDVFVRALVRDTIGNRRSDKGQKPLSNSVIGSRCFSYFRHSSELP